MLEEVVIDLLIYYFYYFLVLDIWNVMGVTYNGNTNVVGVSDRRGTKVDRK
jgi:hypothetical protein